MHGGGAGDAARESGVSPGDDWRVEWYDDDHEYVLMRTDLIPSTVPRSYRYDNAVAAVGWFKRRRGSLISLGVPSRRYDNDYETWSFVKWDSIKQDYTDYEPATAAVPVSPVKRVVDEYPHKCMFCGGKAYMGIVPGSRVDCKSKCQGSSK
jgi:hypothetical protein